MEQIKLNLGGGDRVIDGFVNIDRKVGKEVYPLDYADNSVDEMRASHILEHFGWSEVFFVLTNWFSKLKPGGLIKIAVPDFSKICEMYKNKSDDKVGLYLMGAQNDKDNFHKSVFDKDTLSSILEKAGFVDVKEWSDDILDDASLPVSLNLCAIKPNSGFLSQNVVSRKISAVMSLPRLMFSDNMTCLMRAVVSKGIPLMRSSGVFWGQCLTRLIENELKKKPDYILTIDYDSWFAYEDILALTQLLESHPDYDAVIPIQIKRENESPLVGIKPKDGTSVVCIPKTDLQKNDIYPVDTGHFGLTVFRASCFEKIKKPWFMPNPDADGGWGDGRMDEDIVFWHQFRDSGLKVGLATKVRIGHLQLRITYPGTIQNDWKPVNIGLDEADSDEKRKELIG